MALHISRLEIISCNCRWR